MAPSSASSADGLIIFATHVSASASASRKTNQSPPFPSLFCFGHRWRHSPSMRFSCYFIKKACIPLLHTDSTNGFCMQRLKDTDLVNRICMQRLKDKDLEDGFCMRRLKNTDLAHRFFMQRLRHKDSVYGFCMQQLQHTYLRNGFHIQQSRHTDLAYGFNMLRKKNTDLVLENCKPR